MELNIRELNELIYCIGIARMHGQLLGTTVADSLDERLRAELDKRLEPDYITSESLLNKLKDAAERYSDEVRVKHIHIEEDAFKKVLSSVEEPTKERFNGVSQFILDFVEANNEVTFTEMNDMYKAYTNGSNSFSHILKALLIPYKNRPTQRYLAKTIDGKYRVRIAGIHNWVVVND
jgi:hypothetical protein